MTKEESEKLAKIEARLLRATWLLREWRDRRGGSEHFTFKAGGSTTASPTDLLRDTQRFLEGK